MLPTKSFTGQLSVFYTVIDKLCNGAIGINSKRHVIASAIELLLSSEEQTIRIADLLKDIRDIYILGKSLHFPIALEGALKIKELTYIHAEGIAAGEIKHGPLALIDNNSIVIVINPRDNTYDDVLSNAHEIKSRGATIIGISNQSEDVYRPLHQIAQFRLHFVPTHRDNSTSVTSLSSCPKEKR